MSNKWQTEIERKWVLHTMPQLPDKYTSKQIEQHYLLKHPGELRVRHVDSYYYITVKSDGDLSRSEWEEEIPKWVFDSLSQQAIGGIEKTRYTLRTTDPCLELDVYHGTLEGLVIVEAEWTTGLDTTTCRRVAKQYSLPSWLGPATEVTADSRFKNKTLAMKQPPNEGTTLR